VKTYTIWQPALQAPSHGGSSWAISPQIFCAPQILLRPQKILPPKNVFCPFKS